MTDVERRLYRLLLFADAAAIVISMVAECAAYVHGNQGGHQRGDYLLVPHCVRPVFLAVETVSGGRGKLRLARVEDASALSEIYAPM